MSGTLEETREVWCVTDFRSNMPLVSGGTALQHRLVRRLTTERGRFKSMGKNKPVWPNYGTDLLGLLLSNAAPEEIARQARIECEKDEQVRTAIVTATRNTDGAVAVAVTPITADGPFPFTMTISTAAATLIQLRKSA